MRAKSCTISLEFDCFVLIYFETLQMSHHFVYIYIDSHSHRNLLHAAFGRMYRL